MDPGVIVLLSSVRRNTLKKWYHEGMDSKVTTLHDEELGETVLYFSGKYGNSDYLIFTKRTNDPTIDLTFPHLHFIIKVDMETFGMEVVVDDTDEEQRVFRFSNTYKSIINNPLMCWLPLTVNTHWNHFSLDLNQLVNGAYGSNFAQLRTLRIKTTCKLRKIFMSKIQGYTLRMLLNPRPVATKSITKSHYQTKLLANKYKMNRAAGFRMAHQNKKETIPPDKIVKQNRAIEKKADNTNQETMEDNIVQSKTSGSKSVPDTKKTKLKSVQSLDKSKSKVRVEKQTKSAEIQNTELKSNTSDNKTEGKSMGNNERGEKERSDVTRTAIVNLSKDNKAIINVRRTANKSTRGTKEHPKKNIEEYVESYMRTRHENSARSIEDLVLFKRPDTPWTPGLLPTIQEEKLPKRAKKLEDDSKTKNSPSTHTGKLESNKQLPVPGVLVSKVLEPDKKTNEKPGISTSTKKYTGVRSKKIQVSRNNKAPVVKISKTIGSAKKENNTVKTKNPATQPSGSPAKTLEVPKDEKKQSTVKHGTSKPKATVRHKLLQDTPATTVHKYSKSLEKYDYI